MGYCEHYETEKKPNRDDVAFLSIDEIEIQWFEECVECGEIIDDEVIMYEARW